MAKTEQTGRGKSVESKFVAEPERNTLRPCEDWYATDFSNQKSGIRAETIDRVSVLIPRCKATPFQGRQIMALALTLRFCAPVALLATQRRALS
jgi:hypothetical protein